MDVSVERDFNLAKGSREWQGLCWPSFAHMMRATVSDTNKYIWAYRGYREDTKRAYGRLIDAVVRMIDTHQKYQPGIREPGTLELMERAHKVILRQYDELGKDRKHQTSIQPGYVLDRYEVENSERQATDESVRRRLIEAVQGRSCDERSGAIWAFHSMEKATTLGVECIDPNDVPGECALSFLWLAIADPKEFVKNILPKYLGRIEKEEDDPLSDEGDSVEALCGRLADRMGAKDV